METYNFNKTGTGNIMIRMINKNKKGFTLIEVLVAIVLFIISLLAIVPLLFTAVSVDKESFLKIKAQTMVAEKIEELMSQDISTIGSGNDSETEDGFTLNRVWTVAAGTGNLSLITISVTYTYKGIAKTVTAVAERGL